MRRGIGHLAERSLAREYLRRLDARAVLEHYGAANCTETTNARDGTTEIVHSCLIDRVDPHHRNGDRYPSASCNVDKRLYVCYSGGWSGNLLRFIAAMEGADSLEDCLPVVAGFLAGATTPTEQFIAELERLLSGSGDQRVELPRLDERVLDGWRGHHPYLAERGISAEAAAELRIGYDPLANRVVFPHFVDGHLVGWQKRAIPDRPGRWRGSIAAQPKYKNSPGFPKNETVYHLDAARRFRCAVVVESPMSVARAVSLGLPNVVATFGAKVSRAQIALLADFGTVWVWCDGDPAGLAAERRIVEGLYRHTDVRVVVPDADGRDLADYPDLDSVLARLEGAVPAVLRMPEYMRRHR